jgi:hypothetical protein
MSSNCAVNTDIIGIENIFANSGYTELAKFVLSNRSGFFYNVDEIADSLKDVVWNGEVFSKPFFINSFNSEFQNNKILANTNSFFNRPLSELYKKGSVAKEYMLNSFEKAMVKATFVDGDTLDIKNAVTLDNSHLNTKIQEYKNKLFSNLVTYLKSHPAYKEKYELLTLSALYTDNVYNKNSNFDEVISDIAAAFKNYKTNKSIYNKANKTLLNIYNSAVILTNFDTLIESNFSNLIAINQYNLDSLNIPPYSFQYMGIFKGTSTQYWNKSNSHDDDSADKYASNLVKIIASNIPLKNALGVEVEDRYLGTNRLALIAASIKVDKATYVKFFENPKQELKGILQQMLKTKTVNRGTIKSLFDYLYDLDTGVVDLIDGAKLGNPDLAANVVDIEGAIARHLVNITNPTYGVLNIDPALAEDITNKRKRFISLLSSELT